MRTIRACYLLAFIILLAIPELAMAQQDYEARVYTSKQGQKLKYRLLIPKGYSPTGTETYPLVLFLHGAGERGDDNFKQLVHGTKEFAKDENRLKYPCFVIAPQCPDGKKWVEVDWTADSHKQPEESISLVLTREAIAAMQIEFRVDPKRLYVTGLSMGGFGTWDMITRTPDMFAAAVPVCGGADDTLADKVAKLPIWAFHGDKDTVVKPERSRRMIAAIEQAGGRPKYTEYPGVGHDSWSRAYADPEFMAWLFAQKRP
ncbi:MAG: prolyl oligopeptidase family serine peptidase [Planctomycetes bacterium]|nr:prolyl oligopeptidase family serine peptidase [Planctomycetota bacterium]